MNSYREERYLRFCGAAAPARAVQLALEGYRDAGETETRKRIYAGCLKKRRALTAQAAAGSGDVQAWQRLMDDGILRIRDLERLLETACRPDHAGEWMHLLSLRNRLLTSSENQEGSLSRAACGKAYSDAAQCLRSYRKQVYDLFPYLAGALAMLEPVESPECRSMGTDGSRLLYNADWLLKTGQTCSQPMLRMYVHILLHCLLQHPWKTDPGDLQSQTSADREIEALLEQTCRRSMRMREALGTAEAALEDDHSFFAHSQITMCRQWEKQAARAGDNGAGTKSGGIGCLTAGEKAEVPKGRAGGHDYRTFLQQFALWREKKMLDPENFDYIYYCTGQEEPGHIPLIEPLEYREGYALEQLVIAVDTSGSVSTEELAGILRETQAILQEKENFFKNMEVWILQCDVCIEQVTVIRSLYEWELYAEKPELIGRAGTDFRPVFQFVEQQQRNGELAKLKGLLYFTDGDGIYPREAPPFQTAFVLIREAQTEVQLPKWAQKVYLDQLPE